MLTRLGKHQKNPMYTYEILHIANKRNKVILKDS